MTRTEAETVRTSGELPEGPAGLPTGKTPWALENLPPFPAIATQLLQVVSREDVNLNEVGRFISSEPVFAADVLQIANSPAYGLRSQVKSITHAIVVLGLERIKGISLTRAFGKHLKPTLKVVALQRCWQNSLAGALLAEKLARPCGIEPGLAYTAGLLRDIGRLALLVKYPVEFANMLAVSQTNGYDLMYTERELFDVDHCQAGCWLTERMDLPAELREVVGHHHDKLNGEPFGLVQLVHVADAMADALGFGVLVLPEPPSLDEALEQLPPAARSRIPDDQEELKAEVTARLQVLCKN
ncbi:MAG: HDOD domain-containing protein [Bryobacteraceae bacterium]